MKKNILLTVALCAVLAGCGGRNAAPDPHNHSENETSCPSEAAEAHPETEQKSDPDLIEFSPEQAARTDFAVDTVRRGTFREILPCGGEIYVSQSEVAVVSAPIAGVVTFENGRVMENSAVQAGEGLFRISSGHLASGDAVEKARIAFEQAEADYRRIEALYRDKLVTERDYLAAQAEYLRTKAEYDPVRVADERGTLVKAPAAGYVRQLSVAPGDYVAMGQPLATIARSGRMQLRAWVSQRYFDRIGSFTDAAFRLASDDTFRRISDLGGELYTSGRIISQGTTLVPVVFEFNDDRRCPDGAAAEVILLGNERPDVVTVPLSAVTEQQGIYHVYEQLDPNHYRRRQVWLGGNDGERVEVLRGLEGGERIVTRGAVQVRMAAASGSIPHGHTH